ncbi:family 20 glycosylhydrolase [uncultured Pedobacter sp.]|uniref:family 20 glycosylhydrolase n=1 Tax=uncultured Pedobacter sp. TaxID=246139 RepID=UPI0026033FCF|nr:family 20 glycosylhydrolase [uncultured Pedobacter sp.]
MNKKLSILLVALTLVTNWVHAQQNVSSNLDSLHITWELLQNKYENKNGQFLAQLTFENTSKSSMFKSNNWKLYFNYPREILKVLQGDVKFTYLQGDYSVMMPTDSFKPILPGKKIVVQFVAKGFTQNITDALSGLYFLVDNKTIPVKNFIVKPILNSGVINITAQELYKKYEHTSNLSINANEIVFPTPVSTHLGKGTLLLNNNFKIDADPAFGNEAKLLAADFEKIFGKKMGLGQQKQQTNTIKLEKVAGMGQEAYELRISKTGITIKATHTTGTFYGIKSLTNLFPASAWKGKDKTILLKELIIKDQPRFAYRGLMLDVSRNFQSKEQVKKIIDLMAMYKLNTLHFHLNDDEGWRLEIKSLPELTAVGSKRAHQFNNQNLPPSYGSGPDTLNRAGSGFYSETDFIEILKYATERHVEVIPEIETPGHARAAIKAMQYRYQKFMAMGNAKAAEEFMLVETNDSSKHRSVQGFTDNVMNVALPSTYHFIATVVTDVQRMYAKANAKLSTIHVGGDEVPRGSWEKSPAVQQLVADNVIKSTNDLWLYYFRKVSEIFKSKNLTLAGWEEIAQQKALINGKTVHQVNPGFVDENFKVYVWNTAWGKGNEDLAYKLANAGYKTVLASVSNFYFDMAYSKDNDERGLYWGGYVDTDKPFYFVPLDYYKTAKENYLGLPVEPSILQNKERLTDVGKSNIVGLQCLLWAEKVTTAAEQEYMLFPKLLGFAERAWATSPSWAEEKDPVKSENKYQQSWSFFANVLGKKELPKLASYSGGVAYRIPPVGLIVIDGKVHTKAQFPGLQIRYTTDGSTPTIHSKLYHAPIPHTKGMQFKAFGSNGRSSKTTKL